MTLDVHAHETAVTPCPGRQAALSPFFHTPLETEPNTLAILHLKRDTLLPVTLRSTSEDGYAEGPVTNTRFGSFPHTTLIGLDWGSQVRASKVDTGARGRKIKQAKQQQKLDSGETASSGALIAKKRKPDETSQQEHPQSPTKRLKHDPNGEQQAHSATKVPNDAGSGFIHMLQPTPEAWTSSLDHRTQVVYTPDYSYILQRLRGRPGSTIIEAGAGSGSFTHAAARVVYNGCASDSQPSRRLGKVYSYEYHEPRVQTLRQELVEHGLDSIVELTHRDVCNEGFALPGTSDELKANAVFLDLPAPWLALRHLHHSSPSSPLDPASAVQLCTFSPCIEQVMATVSHLRKNGWTEIQMVEVQNRRIDVRRERVGLKEEGLRGVNASAATVDEAVARLREVESKLSDFHANKAVADGKANGKEKKIQSKAERLEKVKQDAETRKLYKEGNLVQRAEPEVKTHTSYLVFAMLPPQWTEADELVRAEKWPIGDMTVEGPKSTDG